MTKYPYLILKRKLLQILNIPKVQWLSTQLNDEGQAVYHVPSCYIQFLPAQPQALGNNLQAADLTFRVHLYTENIDEDDEVLVHLDLASAIYAKLQGEVGMLSELPAFASLAGTDDDVAVMNVMNRTQYIPDHETARTHTTIQEFTCFCVDLSNAPQYQNVTIALEAQFEV